MATREPDRDGAGTSRAQAPARGRLGTMIAIVGNPAWRDAEPAGPAGRACEIALAAAARGASVELVGRAGDDRLGDALMIALGRAGVGHAAMLRDPAWPTRVVISPLDGDGLAPEAPPASPAPAGPAAGPRLDPADVTLGLGYLTEFRVLVVVDDVPAEALPAAIDGAAFAGARLVLLVRPGWSPPAATPADATILAVPDDGDDGAFGALVGAYASALDAGADPAEAFRSATGSAGWEPAEPVGTA